MPLHLHGVAMGLASSIPVAQNRLNAMARLVNAVEPQGWLEHLAFVRAGGIEIGHLAAPPRTNEVIEGTLANIAAAAKTIGVLPHLENIATLILPPCSTMNEAVWITKLIRLSGAPPMLDVHNLYANAMSFGEPPEALLANMPLDCVQSVHLSGGVWINEPGNSGKQRLLDDHIHDVPDDVFALLTKLATRAREALAMGRARMHSDAPLQVAA